MPEPREIVVNNNGLARWRPEFDSLRIERLGGGGRRISVASGTACVDFDLTAEQAKALAALLDDDVVEHRSGG